MEGLSRNNAFSAITLENILKNSQISDPETHHSDLYLRRGSLLHFFHPLARASYIDPLLHNFDTLATITFASANLNTTSY